MPCTIASIDCNAVAAYAAVAAVVAAIIVAISQTRANLSVQRDQLRTQALLQLLAEWQSPHMLNTRAHAAAVLLNRSKLLSEKTPTQDLNNELDFFDTVAVFHRRGLLDDELTLHTFYWYMVNYWHPSEPYIRAAQASKHAKTWKDLSDLIPKLIRREREEPPADLTTLHFLRGETFAGGDDTTNAFVTALNNPQNNWPHS